VTEAQDRERRLFGTPGLCAALEGRGNDSIDSLRQHILDSVDSWSRGAEQSDDVTVLIVRYRKPA
jgi:serine phosphatase RsbU (regulator of sigma subunit)